MASASAFSLNVKDYGITTVVPDDDVARLMYYLQCVTVAVGLDFLPDYLVRYKDYKLLTPTRIAVVFKTAVELSPDVFIGKVLFRDDEGKVTGTSRNAFVSISAACDIVSLQRDIVIAGKIQDVTKVMFFKSSWLKKFYTDPMERMARAVLGTKHCSHCDGKDPICTCTNACRRPPGSECHPLSDLGAVLLDVLMSPPASNSTPASRRAPIPQPNNHKQGHCDGCGRQFVTAIRYRCTVCKDYELCSLCYNHNVHDTSHPFMQISKPGRQPIYLRLSPRSGAPTTSNNTPSTVIMPAPRNGSPRNPPLPHPRTLAKPPTFHNLPPTETEISSPFFYNSMSVTKLKTFLKERGVQFGDVLDKETLCRRAWDTHCDCMTLTELNTFLSKQDISTVGCRDVNDRRQKAKAAFEPPKRPSRLQRLLTQLRFGLGRWF